MTITKSQSDHGAGVLCLFENQVLLVQMNYGPFKEQWILPGGMLEEGEHPHDAAIREFKEETNIDIELIKLLTVRHRIKSKSLNNTYWIFKGRIITKNPEQNLHWPHEEILSARFWSIDSALNEPMIRPHTKHYIRLATEPNTQESMEALESSFDDFCYKC